jgi:hypothetical protein
MKKVFLFLFLSVISAFSVSCSKDDDNENNSKTNILVGTWKAENDLYGALSGGKWYTVMIFRSDGTFSNYYQNTLGYTERRTDNNHYKIMSSTTFTTYDENMKKMGDYITDGVSFKSANWKNSVYYLTFWKQ